MYPKKEYGIDVSHWQGEPDWKKVAADDLNIKFVFVKATQGNRILDSEFAENVTEANAAGLEVGAYHFYDGTDINSQADYFVSKIKGFKLERELVFDCESNPKGLSGAQLTQEIINFLERVGKLTGRKDHELALYTNITYYRMLDMSKILPRFQVWIARYGVSDPATPGADMWQYTQTGKVDGIAGYVDLDVVLDDGYDECQGEEDTAPVVKPEAVKPTSYTVVSGDTLSEIGVKYGLTVAQLKSYNGLTSDLITIGQKLSLVPKAASAPVKATYSTYTIKSGDTLSEIAVKFNTTVAALKSLNGLKSDMIYAGETLKVKKAVSAPTKQYYKVQSGDYVGKIAAKFDTTIQAIKSLNNLDSNYTIYAGETLRVK